MLMDPLLSSSHGSDPSKEKVANPSSESVAHDAGSSYNAVKSSTSWSSLFSTGNAAQLHYYQPLFANGKYSVFIPKLVHN